MLFQVMNKSDTAQPIICLPNILLIPRGPNSWENWMISQQVYFEAQLPTSFWLLGVWMI